MTLFLGLGLCILLSCSKNVQTESKKEPILEKPALFDSGIESTIPDKQHNDFETTTERETEPVFERFQPRPETITCKQKCVETIAGIPKQSGYRDGPAKQALFDSPRGIALDKNGDLYVSDVYLNRIRKITANGEVVTVAGTGEKGSKDGPAKQATLSLPHSIIFGEDRNLYIAGADFKIRKLTKNNQIITVLGTGKLGHQDGSFAEAMLKANQVFLEPSKTGDLFISDRDTIRYANLKTKKVSTIVGKPYTNLWKDGKRDQALFDHTQELTLDPNGNIYVIETNHIRKITTTKVTTIAGRKTPGFQDGYRQKAMFNRPISIVSDKNGNILVGDRFNRRIRKIDKEGNVTTFAGTGEVGIQDGPLLQSKFGAISSMTVGHDGYLYLTDGSLIRKVDLNCGCSP